MHKRLATLIVVVLASLQLSAQQSSQSEQTSAGSTTQHIRGTGCVKPARQKDCLIVNDIKAHRKYNVFFVGKAQPELYTAISFEGVGYPHVSHCQQGQKVQILDWQPLTETCEKPHTPQSKSK